MDGTIRAILDCVPPRNQNPVKRPAAVFRQQGQPCNRYLITALIQVQKKWSHHICGQFISLLQIDKNCNGSYMPPVFRKIINSNDLATLPLCPAMVHEVGNDAQFQFAPFLSVSLMLPQKT
eukprot:scaffold13696_cov19-Prasinocladus_malaysianus.AAC.1